MANLVARASAPMGATFCALALLTGMLFGAAPAWFATRTNPIEALRGAGRSSGDHSSLTRKALVVLQAAVSVVLVVGSLLLARSLANLQNQDFGFPLAGRVLVQLNRPPASSGSAGATVAEMADTCSSNVERDIL